MKLTKSISILSSALFWAIVAPEWANMSHTLAEGLSKGVGPIKELKLDAINSDLAAKGKSVFTAKCSACHKIEERYVGPGLKDVTIGAGVEAGVELNGTAGSTSAGIEARVSLVSGHSTVGGSGVFEKL